MWNKHTWEEKRRRKNTSGYLEVRYPTHPGSDQDGYIAIHRLIMENHLERFLDALEVVHHVDENKTHNVIENLFLTTNEEHIMIHRMGKKHSKKTRDQMARKHHGKSVGRPRDLKGQFLPKPEDLKKL